MDDPRDVLSALPAFAGISSDDLETISTTASTQEFDTGTLIFREGEAGGISCVVLEGAVELIVSVEGMETTVMTVRDGGFFGVLSWLDGGPRSVTARVVEPARVLAFEAAALDRLRETAPAAAASVLRFLAARLAEATRTIAARFRSLLRWNLDVSGASGLGIDRLITDRIDITLDLMTGSRVYGTLLKVEHSVAGHELFLRSPDGEIAVVPYHAIAQASFPQGNLLSVDEPGGEARDG